MPNLNVDTETLPSLEKAKLRAERLALEAEARAYTAEARFHDLQVERLERARAEEDAQQDAQRILDFTAEVNYRTVRDAIDTLAQWRQKAPGEPITIRLLTPGGDVIAGMALFDYIRLLVAEGHEVTVIGIGMVASMGAVLLQAGSTRLVTPSCFLMVHEMSVEAGGKLSEVADEAKLAQRMQDRILDILTERCTLTRRTIKKRWERKDWWINAQEAVDLGFADAIAEAL